LHERTRDEHSGHRSDGQDHPTVQSEGVSHQVRGHDCVCQQDNAQTELEERGNLLKLLRGGVIDDPTRDAIVPNCQAQPPERAAAEHRAGNYS
jgi:hypothetical protein